MKGFALLGDKAAADDQFGRSAADVDDKALFARRRQGVGAARKDETGFFAAGDDFNRVPESFFGLGQKVGGVCGRAQSLCAHGADILRRNVFELFAEAPQRGKGTLLNFGREGVVGVDAARKAHRFLPVAFRRDAVVFDAAYFHAETVAAQIDRSEQDRRFFLCGCSLHFCLFYFLSNGLNDWSCAL